MAHHRQTPATECHRSIWPHQHCLSVGSISMDGATYVSKYSVREIVRGHSVDIGTMAEPLNSLRGLILYLKTGAGEGIRTLDLRFTKPLLYH